LFFGKNIQRWCHLVHASNFIPIAHGNLHNIWFIAWKMQQMSFDKSLWKKSQWCIAFMMFMNAHANFTRFHPKATSYVCQSILGPPCCKSIWLFNVVIQHFSKCVLFH
jgi:hypothetical protein